MFLSDFLSTVSHVFLPVSIRVYGAVPNPVSMVNSFFIAVRS
jgi:hypothetical protein